MWNSTRNKQHTTDVFQEPFKPISNGDLFYLVTIQRETYTEISISEAQTLCHIAMQYKLLCSEVILSLWPGSDQIVALDLGPAVWPLAEITHLLAFRY